MESHLNQQQNQRDDVVAALLADPRTTEAAIDVAVEAGTVTLTGRVAERSIRQAAEEVAAGRAGVVQVINDLEIDEDTEREDAPVAVSRMAYVESRPPVIPEPHD